LDTHANLFVCCEFCGSLRPRWSYPIRGGSRSASDACREGIERDDREALLDRAVLIPIRGRSLTAIRGGSANEPGNCTSSSGNTATVSRARWATDQLQGSAAPLDSTARRTALLHLMRT
jgi:hypothetical protein